MKKILEFLRIIDPHDGLISLTNVALLVVLGKLVIAPAVGITEIGGLLIALASYQGKKMINKGASVEQAEEIPNLEPINQILADVNQKLVVLEQHAAESTQAVQSATVMAQNAAKLAHAVATARS